VSPSTASQILRVAWATRRDPHAADSPQLSTAARLLAATSQDVEYRPTDTARRAALKLAVVACAAAAGMCSPSAVDSAAAAFRNAARPALRVIN
jgi:hypothetical protein